MLLEPATDPNLIGDGAAIIAPRHQDGCSDTDLVNLARAPACTAVVAERSGRKLASSP